MTQINPMPERKPDHVAPREVREEREEPIKPQRRGFSILRPFRYALLFIDGTFTETLDGMARWARRGAFFGTVGVFGIWFAQASFPAAAALVASTGLGFAPLIVAGFVGGIVAGAAFGAALGAATGGISKVMQCANREHAADEMAKRQAPPPPQKVVYQGPTKAQILKAQKRQAAIEFDQNRELQTEMRHDHVQHEMERRSHGGRYYHGV